MKIFIWGLEFGDVLLKGYEVELRDLKIDNIINE